MNYLSLCTPKVEPEKRTCVCMVKPERGNEEEERLREKIERGEEERESGCEINILMNR